MAETYADHQQRRGYAMDAIDEALASYREFMLDDDFDAQRALDRIMQRLAVRSSFLREAEQTEGAQSS